MTERRPAGLPSLPVLLWRPPPGLDMMLSQEGLPCTTLAELSPAALEAGRFVVYDGWTGSRSAVEAAILPHHVAIDVRDLYDHSAGDPFAAVLSTRARRATWRVGAALLTESVSVVDRAAWREPVIDALRRTFVREGETWIRLAPFPYPYRSAFNLRVDLDEHWPEDYARFARARTPLEDCTTHFVSTGAYGSDPGVLDDLRGRDAQSHGHHHHVYRDEPSNRRNLARADELLRRAGIHPVGFAAPGGRWNAGLDATLESLGYRYSTDFHVGRDDWPFFPRVDGRSSTVLQVPVHPVCEGLFFDAGVRDGDAIASYYASVVREKIAARQPAFVYGHPERRLARIPEVIQRLAEAIEGESLLWRVTLTKFAAWWRWRLGRRWTAMPREGGRIEVRLDDWDPAFTPSLEVVRGTHAALVPIIGPRTIVEPDGLAFERRRLRADLPAPRPEPHSWSLRDAFRRALDWETVTPLAELPSGTARQRLKKSLRSWKSRGGL